MHDLSEVQAEFLGEGRPAEPESPVALTLLPSAAQRPRAGGAARAAGVLRAQRELHRLLLPALHHLLPQLALVLDALQLRLDVLLGDLQQPQDAVVRLLGNHVQHVAEALRAPLAPRLVHAEGHVLRALLPAQQLDVCLALVAALRVVELGAGEDADDLGELDHALRERGGAVLQVLERLLVHLGVKNVVDGVHLRLPILLVHVALLLHLAHGVAVLLDVHLVGRALHREAVHLLAQLQDVALVLAEAALHAAHAQVQRAQAPRGLRAAELGLLLHRRDLLERLLLLLAHVVLEAGLGVGHVAFQVAPDHGHLVEAVAERVLRGVQALLGGCQILVGEIDPAVERVHGLVGVARDLRLRLLQVGLDGSDVVPDCCQDLVHLPTARIHVQPQGGNHVPHCLDGRVQVVVGLLPGHVVDLGVQLRVHLVLQVDDVLRQVLLLLLHLLQGV
mmetsp:Transcript_103691/g.293554  ORF Transcript_103691/g.293554 Transcript_103691/m.293554 type:complete len:448 (-) Transcript_103691:262-1605(-)